MKKQSGCNLRLHVLRAGAGILQAAVSLRFSSLPALDPEEIIYICAGNDS
ncbi:hypothetical protein [Alistipes sp.]